MQLREIYFGEIDIEIIFNGSNSFDHEGEIIEIGRAHV